MKFLFSAQLGSGLRLAGVLGLTLLVSACTSMRAPLAIPGESEAQLLSRLGPPSARHHKQQQQILEYSSYPYGRQTWMFTLDKQGVLLRYEQALRSEVFARLVVDQSNKQDVLYLVGRPYETSYLSLPKLEVWSYPYKQDDVWDSVMHIHFDKDGVVKMLQSGPDPRFDDSDGWRRRMFR